MSSYYQNANLPALLDPKLDMLSEQTAYDAMQYMDRLGGQTLRNMAKEKYLAVVGANAFKTQYAMSMLYEEAIADMPNEERFFSRIAEELNEDLCGIIRKAVEEYDYI